MLKFFIVLITLLLSTHVLSMTVNETTDAGRTIPTAMVLPLGTTSLTAELINPQDVDLFKFKLNTSSTLSIEVLEIDAALDMNLMVFNSLGQGIAGDDDDNNSCTPVTVLGTSLDSCLTLTLAAGVYYFAVGDNNIAAFVNSTDADAGINRFITNDSGILASPTAGALGLVGNSGGLTDNNDVGRYIVNFSQAVGFSPIVIPTLSKGSLILIIILILLSAFKMHINSKNRIKS